MTKPHQNNHKKFWLAGFFNTSKILQNKEKTYLEGCENFENLFLQKKCYACYWF